jgi:hypothetical protein
MVLATFSLLNDWQSAVTTVSSFAPETAVSPFFNRNFLTSISFVAAFAFIYSVNRDKRFVSPIGESIFQIAEIRHTDNFAHRAV